MFVSLGQAIWLLLSFIFIEVIQIYALSSLIHARFDIIILLCNTILAPLPGPEFTHSLAVASSSPISFPFPLRSMTELLLGKMLRPRVNPAKSWIRTS